MNTTNHGIDHEHPSICSRGSAFLSMKSHRSPLTRLLAIFVIGVLVLCGGFIRAADITLPHTENFDSTTVHTPDVPPAGNSGVLPVNWVNVSGENSDDLGSGDTHAFDWLAATGATPSVAPIGPDNDHTIGGTGGNYLYAEDSGNTNDEVHLLTPTFNLTGAVAPELSYWTYSFALDFASSGENSLYLDVMDATGTTALYSNFSRQGHIATEDWVNRVVDLSALRNFTQDIRIRFRWKNQTSTNGRHDIAIDDFTIQDTCGLVVDAITPTNYRLDSGNWVFDLAVAVSYFDAPETTVTINGQTFTISGAVGTSATETFNLTGVAVDAAVSAEFAGFSAGDAAKMDVSTVFPPPAVACSGGNIGGTVYRDFNTNGVQDSGEPGYGTVGMWVAAYGADNAVVGTTPISSDGSYVLTGITTPVRLEFNGLPSWLSLGGIGADSGSSVLFVDAATCDADLAVNNSSDFCQANPDVITSCFVKGDSGGSNGGEDAIVRFPYNSTGSTPPTKLSAWSAVGAIYGAAWQSSKERLYLGAYHRRYAGFGPNGPDAIYQTDRDGNVQGVIELDTLLSGTDVAGTDVHDFTVVDGHVMDTDSFALVGRTSLGDIDLSDDGSTLYVLNLFDRKVYAIDVSAGVAASASLVNPAGWATPDACGDSEHRPMGLKFHDGRLYVGSVCEDGATAYVHSLDPAGTTFSLEVTVPIGFTRQFVARATTPQSDGNWNAWENDIESVSYSVNDNVSADKETIFPQPILSDIEFDSMDGSMILGFRDRWGDQAGQGFPFRLGEEETFADAGGDAIRICSTDSGWIVEGTPSCPTSGGEVNSGPGGASFPEFYHDDFFEDGGVTFHQETFLGALAHLPGTSDLMATIMDPISDYSAGVSQFSNVTGALTNAYTVYDTGDWNGTPPNGATFAKGNGLGDLELLCDAAPLYVGNRLWADLNDNGIQDPGEPGLANVDITLDDGNGNTVTIQTATDDPTTPWDETGDYYFTNATGGNAETVLAEESNFTISVDLTDPDLGYYVRVTTGTDASNDEHDNDADSNGVIAFTTGGAGENDYSQDIGLIAFYDYGDLPEGGAKDFPTAGSSAPDRARHLLGSGLSLGGTVDSEDNGQPSITATGDGADEDGFPYLPDLMPGETYTIPFNATVPGTVTDPVYLNAWIDYDCSGSFDAGEQIATDLVVVDGSNAVTFTVPADATPGVAYSRFRLSTDSGLGATGDAVDGEVEDYLLTILTPEGAIGNYVWLDEDSDGQQNPGEPGIPNVTVQLKDGDGNVIATTVTDTDGGYLFTGLPAGDYHVDVLDSTLASGLSQTTTYTNGSGDFGNKDHSGDGYPITLGVDEVNLTADFGYNHNPTTDVNGGTNTAAIGDTIWFDTDQDGKNDSNEVGIAGVTVALISAGPDGLFGTADDVTEGTTTTDANGNYLFDGLDPDAYIVEVTDTAGVLTGTTQTGDPDHFGTTGTNNDGKTSSPIVLGPGDVFLNADFGYYSDKSLLGSVGDTVWLDSDNSGGDQTTKGSEPGIAGVTIALLLDDGDGIFETDGSDKIIAVDTTDSDGNYLFEGLPLDETYFVWVNDTDNVLDGLTSTYDPDGATDGVSIAQPTAATPAVLTEDFSYAPHPATGSIGDTIWADLDGSGGDQSSQGGEPGIPGVTVSLLDSNGDVVATTVTDSNGDYLFSNLPFGTYTVKVDDTDPQLTGTYNTTPTYDSDGGADSESVVTISPSAPHDRDQDFSYTIDTPTVGSIGDKIWVDSTGTGSAGDGTQSPTEQGLAGVTVTLTPPAGVDLGNGAGVPVTTVTDNEGNYLFTGLPFDGTNPYTVTITPPAGLTNDFDSDGGSDGTSEVIVDSGNPDPRDQDFSLDSAVALYSIGNTIWFDADSDGDRGEDPGNDGSATTREAPISGVRVELLDSNGDVIATDTTDSNGQYQFNNLAPGNYTVRVDTATLPDGISPVSTFENDATANSETDVEIVAADQLGEDFAYPPLGAIGDTVFLDTDNDDTPDIGEGLPGVLVRLYGADGTTVIAETTTDANGRYLFSDLPAGNYTVEVDPNNDTLPPGVANTEDPDNAVDTQASPGDSKSAVVLGVGETNLAQDFGYRGLGTIGNLVFLDLNADGEWDGTAAGETLIAGVTIDLYRDLDGDGQLDPGEPKIGTTTTGSSIVTTSGDDGNYLFTGLPTNTGDGDADYIVEVSDTAGVLSGYWHSLGSVNATDHSQADPYAVSITDAAPENLTADFGYYLDPGKLGNYVFEDTNKDGIQDSGEEGIDGVEMTLTITYPNNDTITLKTLTGDDPSTTGIVEKGWYNFCGLLQDEDYRGAGGAGEPTYTIAITPPAGTTLTLTDQDSGGANPDREDSDASGVSAQPVQGSQNVAQNADPTAEENIASYDFGIVDQPKSATFADYLADNAALLNLDDNSQPGVPATNPLDGTATGSTDTDGDDGTGAAQLAALAANSDGDIYNNLLEYALCFDPASGAKVTPGGDPNAGFHIEMNGSLLDAKYLQPTGAADITYTLQSSTDGQTWSDVSEGTGAGEIERTTVDNPNGTTTVCYSDLASELGEAALLRLLVNGGSGALATNAVTPVQGYQKVTIKDFCQTYSDPLLEPCLVTGTITGVSGQILDLSGSLGSRDLTTLLAPGTAYYLEITSGENTGHIFDIQSTTADSVTLATVTAADQCNLTAPYSTTTLVPADLAADTFVIRAHKTLENLFPIDDIDTMGTSEGFADGTNATNAGALLRLNRATGMLETYLANSTAGVDGESWIATTTTDPGSGIPDNILPPGEGIFTHNLAGQTDLMIMQFGEVRTNQLAVPLKEGYNLIGSGHPLVAQSIDGPDSASRQMNATDQSFVGSNALSLADQVQLWADDADGVTAASVHLCYSAISYLNLPGGPDQWTQSGGISATEEDNKPLFDPARSTIYCIQPRTAPANMLGHYLPSPITNQAP